MHSAVLFISKHNSEPASADEISGDTMKSIGSDYWGDMYLRKEVMRSVAEGDCPMFVPASEGKYSVNQKYVDRYFEGCYKNMMEAAKRLIGMSLDDLKAFGFEMGFEVFTIKSAYSDTRGFSIKGDDDDFHFDTQAEFLRWDRHQLEKSGKAPEYYIRGMMDFHF